MEEEVETISNRRFGVSSTNWLFRDKYCRGKELLQINELSSEIYVDISIYHSVLSRLVDILFYHCHYSLFCKLINQPCCYIKNV